MAGKDRLQSGDGGGQLLGAKAYRVMGQGLSTPAWFGACDGVFLCHHHSLSKPAAALEPSALHTQPHNDPLVTRRCKSAGGQCLQFWVALKLCALCWSRHLRITKPLDMKNFGQDTYRNVSSLLLGHPGTVMITHRKAPGSSKPSGPTDGCC